MSPRISPNPKLTNILVAKVEPETAFIPLTVPLTAFIIISSYWLSESYIGMSIESLRYTTGSRLARVKRVVLNRTESESGILLADTLSGAEKLS